MNNMDLYNSVRKVPAEAIKTIGAGRLKGFSDINPMWRIKTLTEQFGACGIGWYYTIDKQWIEPTSTNEVAAFVNISLYVKIDGEWSRPIVGTGGNKFIAAEKNGLYVSDECFKMALTDALSIACKSLGIGADVYYAKDRTKYDAPVPEGAEKTAAKKEYKCCDCGKVITDCEKDGKKYTAEQIYNTWIKRNVDGQPRCTECSTAKGTLKNKETK